MNLTEFKILEKPVITERSANLKEKFNQYVFRVTPDANKQQIRDAIQKLFKVNVLQVRTVNYAGKLKRLGMSSPLGRKNSWKKAFVTVQAGQEIKIDQEAPK